ncbi:hypothetical protein NC653_016882 [Populus alba x Populus x berolinensis]|uniref:Uncharacterized protein n=1 Tax=Populus alba x Populus x berolinensis TaxID=444605 RepID=A0AAD6QP26_9ROSI|nr:hypothetical protein NC653_016882 [Populus alba x Populus x berolinensis]
MLSTKFKMGLSSSAAHSSLDDHLARWFGLNQSKYQWALDDYYETKGLLRMDQKTSGISLMVNKKS